MPEFVKSVETTSTNGKPEVQMPQEKQPDNGKRVISEKQGNRLLTIASTNGYTKELVKDYIKNKYSLENLRDITTDIYDEVVEHFEKKDV